MSKVFQLNLVIFFVLLFPTGASVARDVIHLKNGKVLKGHIITTEPGKFVVIEVGKTRKTVIWDTIAELEEASSPDPVKQPDTLTVRKTVSEPMKAKPATGSNVIGVGSGCSLMLGDLKLRFSFAIPVQIGYQYAVWSHFSLGPDTYFWLVTGSNIPDTKVLTLQFGGSFYFWFNKAYDGAYLGTGLAYTYQGFTVGSAATSGSSATSNTVGYGFGTLVFKAGYVFLISGPVFLDLGIRYDGIGIVASQSKAAKPTFGNQPLTAVIALLFRF